MTVEQNRTSNSQIRNVSNDAEDAVSTDENTRNKDEIGRHEDEKKGCEKECRTSNIKIDIILTETKCKDEDTEIGERTKDGKRNAKNLRVNTVRNDIAVDLLTKSTGDES